MPSPGCSPLGSFAGRGSSRIGRLGAILALAAAAAGVDGEEEGNFPLVPGDSPLALRIALKGELDGRSFGPLAATLRIAREKVTRRTTVSIAVDADQRFGSILWLAASAEELEARVEPFVFSAGDRSLEIRIADTEVYAFRMPTWVSAVGEIIPGQPTYSLAKSGFLKLEMTEAGVRGRVELTGKVLFPQRESEYRADISPLADAGPLEEAAPPAPGKGPAEAEMPLEMRLASFGDALFFEREYERAAEHFGDALAIYRSRTDRPSRSLVRDGDWISQKNLLVKLALCHLRFEKPQYGLLLGDLLRAVEVDRRLQATGYLRAELRTDPYFPYLEKWRQIQKSDAKKVAALEQSQEFLEILLIYFLDQQRPELALEVAELARSRAYADLLAERKGEVVPPEPLTYRDIRARVARRPGPVIEYFVTEEFLAIWLLTPAGEMTFASTPVPRRELEEKLGAVRAAIEGSALAKEGSVFRADLRQLYDWLLAPVADRLPAAPAGAVTIVGHGQLLRLPFAALPFGEGREDWVVFRHALLYVPSLAVLEQIEERSPAEPKWQLLAFLDPQPLPEALGKLLPARAMASRMQAPFPSGKRRFRAEALATETRFKLEAGGAKVLVLATHAFAERAERRSTAVLLGMDPPANDGYLEPGEIEGLRLSADLVVLTACQSGRGEVTADGVQGLARAFFVAGARALLATLWSVPLHAQDQAVQFVEKASRSEGGAGQAEALRLVQAEVARNNLLQPTVWAGFALFG